MNIATPVPTHDHKSQHLTTELPGGQMIAAGKSLKAALGTIEISFGTKFAEPPIVVVSPVWPDGAVGGIETIQGIQNDRFQVNSGNAGTNYYVDWIAVGRR